MKRILILTIALLLTVLPSAAAQLPSAAEFAGGSISCEEAAQEFASTMQSYTEFGWTTDAADPMLVAQQVLEQMVEDAVLRAKAAELGLDRIADDEMNALREEAAETYETQLSYYTALAGDADRAGLIESLALEGFTQDAILKEMIENRWYSKLYEYICSDVTADESYIADYAASLAATQALQFADDPLYFDYLYMNDDLIAYYPEGMRYIKHILVGFDEEQALAYQALIGDGTQAEADPEVLDALYAELDERVAAVEQQLLNGADFDEMMRTYGADALILEEPYATDGYIVQPGSDLFVDEFVSACFALQEPGDISDPVRTSGGVHFILYAGDVPSGPVAQAQIADAIAMEAQEQLISDTFDAQVEEWIAEAQPVYHPEYLLQ